MSFRVFSEFESELDLISRGDQVSQGTEVCKWSGLDFISTAGHGYLVVPKGHPLRRKANELCKYGYKGKLATYLEEDCEAPAFIKLLKASK